jgi:hypothetical protein
MPAIDVGGIERNSKTNSSNRCNHRADYVDNLCLSAQVIIGNLHKNLTTSSVGVAFLIGWQALRETNPAMGGLLFPAGGRTAAGTSRETSPSLNREPQNSRITNHAKDVIYDPNFEGWFRSRSASACAACARRGAESCLKLTEFISATFDIPCSTFVMSSSGSAARAAG